MLYVQDDISWHHVTTPGPVLLPLSDLDLLSVMIGVSVDLGSYSTGFVWSDCPKFDGSQRMFIVITELH